MRQKLFLVLMALLFLPATKALADYALQLHLKDGTKQTFLIAAHPNLTVKDKVLSIKGEGIEFSCELAQVDHYNFPSNIDPSAVNAVKEATGVRKEGDRVEFSGLKAGSTVAVYTSDGKCVSSAKASADGTATVVIKSLPTGVLILKAGSNTTKIIKK